VVALIVLVNVLGPGADDDADAPPASLEGSTPSARADLPVLAVPVPEVTPEAETACPDLMAGLPLELAGEPSRRVDSETPYAYAWGEPATVLVCGVDRPDGFDVASGLIQINGVQWYVDTSDPRTTVWTAVDREVYVEVQVPAESDSAGVTELTIPLAETLERRAPDPAG
jgi:Protein of unknown function (DUF3515)